MLNSFLGRRKHAIDPDNGKVHPDFEALGEKVKRLSPQLYVQLVLQVQLMGAVLEHGVNYFVQRGLPKIFRELRSLVDSKDPAIETQFEQAFRVMGPGLLRAISESRPFTRFEGFDYPFLRDANGEFELGRLVRNTKFKDSRSSDGLQVVDLLASGTRRMLRNEFGNNDVMAALLGKLMIEAPRNQSPIGLFTVNPDADNHLDDAVQKSLELIQAKSKVMLI